MLQRTGRHEDRCGLSGLFHRRHGNQKRRVSATNGRCQRHRRGSDVSPEHPSSPADPRPSSRCPRPPRPSLPRIFSAHIFTERSTSPSRPALDGSQDEASHVLRPWVDTRGRYGVSSTGSDCDSCPFSARSRRHSGYRAATCPTEPSMQRRAAADSGGCRFRRRRVSHHAYGFRSSQLSLCEHVPAPPRPCRVLVEDLVHCGAVHPLARDREMMSRRISLVPSPISSSLASRIHFSAGYSRE